MRNLDEKAEPSKRFCYNPLVALSLCLSFSSSLSLFVLAFGTLNSTRTQPRSLIVPWLPQSPLSDESANWFCEDFRAFSTSSPLHTHLSKYTVYPLVSAEVYICCKEAKLLALQLGNSTWRFQVSASQFSKVSVIYVLAEDDFHLDFPAIVSDTDIFLDSSVLGGTTMRYYYNSEDTRERLWGTKR